MRIKGNGIANNVMALDDGDIFKYGGYYYIAGERNYQNCTRECYNLSQNYVINMKFDPVVEYWHGYDSILTLCDKLRISK